MNQAAVQIILAVHGNLGQALKRAVIILPEIRSM